VLLWGVVGGGGGGGGGGRARARAHVPAHKDNFLLRKLFINHSL